MRRLGVLAVWASLAMLAAVSAHAAKPKWDQAANVRSSAERLAVLQKRQGADAVVKFLDACYRTHTLASAYSEALEGCMAQDLMFSRVLATVYARLPPEARSQKRLPSADQIAAAMSSRINAVVAQYKLSDDDRKALLAVVETHGMPVFMKAMFPNLDAAPASKQ